MRITVRLFAILRDRAKRSEISVELPEEADVSAALEAVAAQVTAIRDLLPRIAFAVNREYVKADHVLRDGDELALIPPVSGGAR